MKELFCIYIITSLLQIVGCYSPSHLTNKQKVNSKMSIPFNDFSNLENEISFEGDDMIVIKTSNGTVHRLAITETIKLEYDTPLDLHQNFAAYCDTTHQVESVLSIQNLSKNFKATFFISPSVDANESGIYEIPSNSSEPIRIVNNWDGSTLKVANISSKEATIKVTIF